MICDNYFIYLFKLKNRSRSAYIHE